MITNSVLDYIYETHHHRTTSWNNSILYPAALQQYADAIFDQGAALSDCFGFVDGTVRPICRPDENLRIVFNGHKRVHAIKFQSVALPNGLVIGHLYGPLGESLLVYHHSFKLSSFNNLRLGFKRDLKL